MLGLTAARMLKSPDARHQLLRFLVVGTGNTLFAYALYAAGLFFGLRFELASLAALLIGIVVSFLTQGRLVFTARLKGRFPVFVAAWALLYYANITLIRLFGWAGLDDYLAGLVATVPVTGMSFLIQRKAVFATPIPPARVLIPAAAVFILAVARLDLALRHELNWDEFLNLAMIHEYARGELREVLQTAFIHLFGWVPLVSVNEVDQVIAARLLVYAMAVATSAALYGIARRFMDTPAALVAVLAFNGFSFVMRHGNPLRTDPMAACVLTVAIWLALSRAFDWRRALALGLLVGIGGAFTIKSVFYVPTLAAVLLLRVAYAQDRKVELARGALAGASALATFLAITALHASTFPDTASATAFVSRTSGELLFSGDYSVFLTRLRPAVLGNFAFWILFAVGLAGAITLTKKAETRHDGLALLSLSLPLLAPAIYRDVYPYFFAFMLAPPSVLAGFGLYRLAALGDGRYARIALTGLVALAAIGYVQALKQGVEQQRRVVGLVHRLFPQPVPYIDHTSMISAYPKQGFFMSSWGMADYRRTGKPVMAQIIRTSQPRFVLVTRGLLDVETIDPTASERHPKGLLAEDVRTLQANYMRYWGPIYLPGYTISGRGMRPIDIAGAYRLDGTHPVTVDGRLVSPGEVLHIAAGNHSIVADSPATLRWDAPAPPAESPPALLFHTF